MTEYETASLALQTANLDLRRYAIIAQVQIGAAQCLLIAGGLWLIKKAASARDAQHQEARDQHQETMVALHHQSEALRQQGDALNALIERTALPR